MKLIGLDWNANEKMKFDKNVIWWKCKWENDKNDWNVNGKMTKLMKLN